MKEYVTQPKNWKEFIRILDILENNRYTFDSQTCFYAIFRKNNKRVKVYKI